MMLLVTLGRQAPRGWRARCPCHRILKLPLPVFLPFSPRQAMLG